MTTHQALDGSRSRVAWLGALALTLFATGAGCHHASYSTTAYPSSPRSGAAGEPVSSADAPSAAGESTDASERPGLGTTWGENRHAPVRSVSFDRQSASPTFVASLLYNDSDGVAALRSRIGRRYRTDEPLFRSFASSADIFGGVIVRVVDGSGASLPAYHVGDRVLLLGEAGQRYAIEIDNRTDARFEIVASVDGLDVVDGRPASLDKPGYVISPYSHLRIEGFRRSMSEVATFRFGAVRDSYAAQSADFADRHVGVIGVALFAERGSEWGEWGNTQSRRRARDLDEDAAKRESADPFPGRFAQPPPDRQLD